MGDAAKSLSPALDPDTARTSAEGKRKKAYAVQHWKPRHDQIVALHIAGYPNKEIAAILDCSVSHVSDIINDPRAQQAISEIQHRQFRHIRQRVEEKLTLLSEQAVENIAKTVNADIDAGTPAKKHQDRVSFDLLAEVRENARDKGDDSGVSFSPEVEERLVEALEESKRVHEVESQEIE